VNILRNLADSVGVIAEGWVRKPVEIVLCIQMHGESDFLVIVVYEHDGRTVAVVFCARYEYGRPVLGQLRILEQVISIMARFNLGGRRG
jgi:hypothetical protein